MAGDARSALIQGQQPFLGIEGFVMDRHGAQQPFGQGADQGLPIAGAAEGGDQSPSLRIGIELAAIGQQMPPAHARPSAVETFIGCSRRCG